MKAWQLSEYNSDVPAAIASLTLKDDVAVPSEIGPEQVLVKVRFASVNPIDWKLFSGGLHGICPIARFPYTPGFDVAGTVEKVGSAVTDIAVGDAIIADIGLVESCIDPAPTPGGPAGAFAQYAAVPASICVQVQQDQLETLAGLPLAGLTAYQMLFTGEGKSFSGEPLGDAKAGSKVLILGGSTSVGIMAVQMAKAASCHVTATASSNLLSDGTTSKLDFVKSLGADEVLDYKTQDWGDALAGKDFDLILDTAEGSMEDLTLRAPKVLKKGGDFVSIVNFDPAAKSSDDVRFAIFLLKSNRADLKAMVDMVNKGDLKIPIEKVYPLEQVKEALTKSLGGRSVGKLVIKVDH